MLLAQIKTFFAAGFVSFVLLFPAVAFAQSKTDLCTGANLTFSQQGCNEDSRGRDLKKGDRAESRLNKLIADIVNILSVIVGVVAVIMIIIGGFKYITSGGDSGNVTSAKNTIIYAIVGLIIVAFAQFIVKFVLDKVA